MTLRVTVEIVPHGVEEEKRKIAVFNISNLGPFEDSQSDFLYGVEKNRYKTGVYDYDILLHFDEVI